MADVQREAEAKPPTVSQKPNGKKGRKKIILIAALGLVVLMGAGSFFYLFPRLKGGKGPNPAQKSAAAEKPGHVYALEPFLVNLADPEASRYLKIRLELESNETKPDEEYEKKLPQIRDALLSVLFAKTYQEVLDSEGKRRLKDEIISKVNPLLSHFKFKKVYFTEFMVQ
jgi:flagellar protein FliL